MVGEMSDAPGRADSVGICANPRVGSNPAPSTIHNMEVEYMANYCCATRTNYFRVKDPDKFRSFMSNVCTDENHLQIWEEEKDGRTVFGFGGYGQILGIPIYESGDAEQHDWPDDYDFDGFVYGLSELVAEDDAVIIIESGNENSDILLVRP